MNPLGWKGNDEGLYWPKSVMDAAWKVYWAAYQFRDFRLEGAEILAQLRNK